MGGQDRNLYPNIRITGRAFNVQPTVRFDQPGNQITEMMNLRNHPYADYQYGREDDEHPNDSVESDEASILDLVGSDTDDDYDLLEPSLKVVRSFCETYTTSTVGDGSNSDSE